MKRSFWDKRIPTLLGLFFVGISTLVITYMVQSPQIFQTGATVRATPQDIRISNQSDTSVTISFQTNEPASAQIRFGTTLSNTKLLFDDRDDIGGNVGIYRMHYYTVRNLSPGQTYVFSIVVGQTVEDNSGNGFSVKTASQASTAEEEKIDPIIGIIHTDKGADLEDAIVFARIDGAGLLSTLVKSQGQFFIPLTNIYTTDLTGQYAWNKTEVVSIEVVPGDSSLPGLVAKIPFEQGFNLGTLVLGKNIDLTVEDAPAPAASAFDTVLSQEPVGATNPSIVTPQDGAFVIDPQPLIRGNGNPLQTVEVTVQSEPETAVLTIDQQGNWRYQPQVPLEPGKHTVTVKFFESGRVVRVLTRDFEVLASGLQIADAATPPATIETPTPIPISLAPTVSIQEPTVAPLPNTATVLPGISIAVIGAFLLAFGFFALRL